MAVAPLLAGQASIFSYLQKMNGLYFIPILSVVVVGIVSRRVPAAAAKFGLAFSFLLLAAGYFIPLGTAANGTRVYFTDYIHNLHFLGGVFAYTVIIMLVWGNLRPRKTEFIQQDVQAVDMTPWKYAVPAGITLIMIVLAIYAHFADFSILLNPQP
jgi:SSS family solute:Na+ symporter